MIVKFIVPLGEEREIRPGVRISGALAVVQAPSIDEARSYLRRECDILGMFPWDEIADVTVVPDAPGIIALAM